MEELSSFPFQYAVSASVIPLAIEVLNTGSVSVYPSSLLFQYVVSEAVIPLATEPSKIGSVSFTPPVKLSANSALFAYKAYGTLTSSVVLLIT